MQIEKEVHKQGNSLAIRMSGILKKALDLKEGDLLTITIKKDGFYATKVKQKRWSEKELLANINVNNAHTDLVPNLLSNEYE